MVFAPRINTLNILPGILALLGGVLLAAPAHAACSNPAGTVGNMEYFAAENIYRYCDDTNWIDVGNKAGDVTSGLVAHWKLDEASGTTANDSSGGNNGTLTSFPGSPWTTGLSGGALNFDGADDYIDAGSPASLDNLPALTLAGWIRPDTLTSDPTLFSKDASSAGWQFDLNASGNMEFWAGYSVDSVNAWTANSAVATGTWSHVAVTWDGTTNATGIKFYVNGVNIAFSGSDNGSVTRDDDSANSIFIGRTLWTADQHFDGLMDDMRIYNRVLTAAEIATLAQTADTTGLVLHWKLDEGTGTTAGDSSTGGNAGTLRGGAAWTANGYSGSGVTFDGTDDCIDEAAVNLSGTDDITVSGWYKRNWGVGGGGYETLYEGSADFNSSTTGFAIFPTGSGPATCPNYKLEVYLRGNTGHSGKCYDPPGDTNWHMLTAVYDKSQTGANEVAFYIDGVLQTATSSPHNSNNTNNFGNDEFNFMTRNCNATSAAEAVAGTSDDLRIYNRALSAGEIAALIDCTSPAGRRGMVNYNTTTHRYEYCNGTSWVQMDSQCANNNGGGGCTGGIGGTMRYNTADNTYEYCEGDTWTCVGEKCYQGQINGVTFDPGTDYLTGSALTGVDDGKTMTGSFWFRRNGGIGSTQETLNIGGSQFRIAFDSGNKLRIQADNPSATEVLRILTSSSITDTNWHHFMFSVDMSNTSRRHIYLDGSPDMTVSIYTNDLLNYGGSAAAISRSAGNVYNGDLADFWFDAGTYIDLSVAANRAKFYNGGEPVNLGCDGSYPTGNAPDIFLSGDTANWHTNKGTGGGFTENGALTDAASDP